MTSHTRCVQHSLLALWLIVLSAGLLPGMVGAAELGRLFSTPSERLHLNQMRNAGGTVSMPTAPESASQATSADVPIRFNGFVRRSSGQRDAWINGRHAGSDQRLSRKLGSGNTMRIRVPDSSRTVRMKAGQVMDPFTGKVQELYEAQQADHAPAVTGSRASGG